MVNCRFLISSWSASISAAPPDGRAAPAADLDGEFVEVAGLYFFGEDFILKILVFNFYFIFDLRALTVRIKTK